MPFPADITPTSTSDALIKTFPHFHQQLMIAPTTSVFWDNNYEYKSVSLQVSLSMLIAFLFPIILNFHLEKMVLAFNF